jgi:hypothetical protein
VSLLPFAVFFNLGSIALEIQGSYPQTRLLDLLASFEKS